MIGLRCVGIIGCGYRLNQCIPGQTVANTTCVSVATFTHRGVYGVHTVEGEGCTKRCDDEGRWACDWNSCESVTVDGER